MNIKRATQILNKAEMNESILSPYERNFVDALSNKLEHDSIISDRQAAVLERIGRKCE